MELRANICPDYAQGDVPFSAACDVYSLGVVFAELIIGCLQGGQSSRNGESFGSFFRRYISDKYHEKVAHGSKILFDDADPSAGWDAQSLKHLCELTLQCLTQSPLRRPTTSVLTQTLGEISRVDFGGSLINSASAQGSNDKKAIKAIKVSGTKSCVLCNESVGDCISCSKMHVTCIRCLEHRILIFSEK